ncbi:hypothetical protein [Dactylosporangium salmoneum]|uniref:AAA+ ATPase domain-containing protein n=1 Tax=Dactylosporangium salmoneum TaxID=53361 RepID=A0ABP5UG11_9ACTN
MPKGLSYADAVKLLTGGEPAAILDLESLLAMAAPRPAASTLDRVRRLQAANAVLVMTALVEVVPAELHDIDPPALGPAVPFGEYLARLHQWYVVWATILAESRSDPAAVMADRAVGRYEAGYRRLAAAFPEVGMWAGRVGPGTGDAPLAEILAALDPARERAEWRRLLDAAHQADVRRPVAGDEQDTTGCVVPSLDASYVTARFRARAGGRADNPADEGWWEKAPVRADLLWFVAAHLSTPEAAAGPLVVLGQPGSGKSALTRILAARLGVGDFMPIRVPLRDVPADADVQEQIEHAVRLAVNERTTWPELARAAAGALPVVLLDGFDELLQATGVGQSDYLLKVARFQQQQEELGRPVAVVVTSRIAVANRSPLPDGAIVVRLEPFDEPQVEAWLSVWNGINAEVFARRGVRRLGAATALCWPELAVQPLLLFMLALYDAQDNALSSGVDDGLTRAALYERLVVSFAEREVRKDRPGPLAAAVERELLLLSVVAFAMLNRDRQWVTTTELDADLAQLDLAGAAADTGFADPQTAGERALARFFFVHRAQAVVQERKRYTYEFLHATFGDFLAARLVARVVGDAVARDAAGASALRPAAPHDDLLYALLSFAPLSGQDATTLDTLSALLGPDAYDWLCRAFRLAVTRPDVPAHRYAPAPLPAGHRLLRYGLNLVLLACCAKGEVSAADLFPDDPDPAGRLGRAAHGWQCTLTRWQWSGIADNLRVERLWLADRRETRLRWNAGAAPVFDAYWNHGFGPDSNVWEFDAGGGFSGLAKANRAANAMALRADRDEEVLAHALEPLRRVLQPAIISFAVHERQQAESVAHSLIRAWVTAAGSAGAQELHAAGERLVHAVTSYAWGLERCEEGGRAIDFTLAWLAANAKLLPPAAMESWLTAIVQCIQFTPAHKPGVLMCAHRHNPGGFPAVSAALRHT